MELKPTKRGIALDLTKPYFDHTLSTIRLLETLAKSDGHKHLGEWVSDDDFDPDTLFEADAEYFKSGPHHNYYWAVKQRAEDKELRVGLDLWIPRGKRKPKTTSLSIREFSRGWQDD